MLIITFKNWTFLKEDNGSAKGDTAIHVGGKDLYRWKRKGGPFLKKEITSGRLFLSISPCRHMESVLNAFKCIFIMTVLVVRQQGVDDFLSLISGMPAHDMRGFEVWERYPQSLL
jgi:hypothetical protein